MTLIIAEAGVNHNGKEELAIELVNEAYKSGADIVKFQTFKAKNIVTKKAIKADYQLENTEAYETQFSMLEKLELSYNSFIKIKLHCESLGIEFLSTAFDEESLKFLTNELGLKRLKIPSGEINNAPLILAHAALGLDLIVSTGMCDLDDIKKVLGVIAYGYLYGGIPPENISDFNLAFESKNGQDKLKDKVTLLHCTTEYPAPIDEINLNAMHTLSEQFNLPYGYSDHSEGIMVSIAAASLGACIIEKHFTLDTSMEGPDHLASLAPEELSQMVKGIRQVTKALGSSIKSPSASEVKNIDIARKCLVALRDIKKGEKFTIENLGCKRAGKGVSPYYFWEYLDKTAVCSFEEGQAIYD